MILRAFPVLPGFIDEGQRHDMIFVDPKTHMHWTRAKTELGSFNRTESLFNDIIGTPEIEEFLVRCLCKTGRRIPDG